jgi:hypothetical protein
MLLIFCSCLYSVLIKPTCLLSIIRNGLVFLITSFASFYFDLFRSICFYFLFFYTKSVISAPYHFVPQRFVPIISSHSSHPKFISSPLFRPVPVHLVPNSFRLKINSSHTSRPATIRPHSFRPKFQNIRKKLRFHL